MFTKEEPMGLLNLGGGVAVEMFDQELQRVLDNIVDINTRADQVREISLKVKIKPDEERMLGEITVECNSKTSAVKGFVSRCMIGKSGRTGHARELESAQMSFLGEKEKDKVTPINGGKRKGAGDD